MPLLLVIAAIAAFLLGYGLVGWVLLIVAICAALASGPLL